MVIQVETEVSWEAAVQKQNMEPKKYIVVKNHVREITNKEIVNIKPESCESGDSVEKKSKSKKLKKQESSSSEDNVNINEISKNDLDELKAVYKKCKAVLTNFESKYRHLLNLDTETDSVNKRKRKQNVDTNDQNECCCKLNKKIIFNDDGQQVYEEAYTLDSHNCANKLKSHNSHFPETYQNIQIESESDYNNLPETIQELTEILKNPSIKSYYRRNVINKIKYIRQEHLNMIRFDKHKIIQKLKLNPDEIMEFKGANVSSISGYPDQL